MSVKTYDAGSVSIIFAGIPFEGLADGTFVTVARDNPSFNSLTGSDGEGARAKSNDKSGTITCTLMQTSVTNDLLSEVAALDELTGDGVAPLMVKDNSGRTIASAETAWIEKPADAEFGREISNREWVIKTTELNLFVGGN
jgi:hypothetical protein